MFSLGRHSLIENSKQANAVNLKQYTYTLSHKQTERELKWRQIPSGNQLNSKQIARTVNFAMIVTVTARQ